MRDQQIFQRAVLPRLLQALVEGMQRHAHVIEERHSHQRKRKIRGALWQGTFELRAVYEFGKKVKTINKDIKAVLTSGYNFSATDISNNGYDEFLQLPMKLSTLVSTAKEMLNS